MSDAAVPAGTALSPATAPSLAAAEVEQLLGRLKYDAAGLIAAVAQDYLSGDVLMVAWMDRAAVAATFETANATFFSRSRQRQWIKGETSGHFLRVHSVHVDCDADTLLLRVKPAGPSCHTGRPTCFFTEAGPATSERPPQTAHATFLSELETEIRDRQLNSSGAKSYTRSLLDGGAERIGGKLREEADELARAIANEPKEHVASEAADVLYHLMVGLRSREVPFSDVLAVLAKRSGVSGLVEKANRGTR